MVRFSSRFLVIVAAVAIVAMASQVAMAQNEKGGRGRGGRGRGGPGGFGGPVSMVQLATVDKVQDALKLKDDQKEKVAKINDELRDERRKLLEDGGTPDREKMQKMQDASQSKLNEVLDEGQQKRLMGIFVQVAGAGAVMNPVIAKELEITDEQKTKLREAMGAMFGGRGGRAGRDGKGEGKADGQSFADRRAKMDKEISAVLTADQQKKLESLKGEKVDIDMSQLRQGRGGERRERPNRDSDKAAEKKAAA
jgi:Spy/CpxP family protein refolding chaperone